MAVSSRFFLSLSLSESSVDEEPCRIAGCGRSIFFKGFGEGNGDLMSIRFELGYVGTAGAISPGGASGPNADPAAALCDDCGAVAPLSTGRVSSHNGGGGGGSE